MRFIDSLAGVTIASVALLTRPTQARAEMSVGGIGVMHTRSTTTVDTPKHTFHGSQIGYGLGGAVYLMGAREGAYIRMSWNVFGMGVVPGKASYTSKGTDGIAMDPNRTLAYSNDAFLLVLPRIDLGFAWGSLPIKPSLGVSLKDGYLGGSKFAYLSIDPGVTFGLPMGFGDKKFGVVVFPSATYFVSGYNHMKGGGTGHIYEVAAALGAGPWFAEVRLALEEKKMPYERFGYGAERDVDVLTKDTSLKFLLGFLPQRH